jgi:hypothetical protein
VTTAFLRTIENIELCGDHGHAKVLRELGRRVVIEAVAGSFTSAMLELFIRGIKAELNYRTWGKDRKMRFKRAMTDVRKIARNWDSLFEADRRAFLDGKPASWLAEIIDEMQREIARGKNGGDVVLGTAA